MRLALFGASGRTGGLIMDLALSAGHRVKALVRDPSKLRQTQTGLCIIRGDARQAIEVAEVVQDVDAVISALGGGGDTLTQFGRNAMAAMEHAGVKRIVSLVGASIVVPGDVSSLGLTTLSLITRTFGGDMLKDGEVHATELRGSNLDYTLVRPPRLTNRPGSGRIQHALRLNLGPTSSIPRETLAAFMLEVALTGKYIRAAPMVAG